MIDGSIPKRKTFCPCLQSIAVWSILALWFWIPCPGFAESMFGRTGSPYFGGEKLFHEGKYVEAKSVFQEFLERHPDDPRKSRAVFRLGQIEYRNGFYVSALKYFQLFNQHYSDSAWVFHARLKMGECYFYLERYAEATKLFVETVKTSPDPGQKWKAYSYLGQIDDRRKDYLSAVRKYQRLIEKGQDDELKRFARQSIEAIIRKKLDTRQLAKLANLVGNKYPAAMVLIRLIEMYRDERELGNYQIALENFLIRFPKHPLGETYHAALKRFRLDKNKPIRIGAVLPLRICGPFGEESSSTVPSISYACMNRIPCTATAHIPSKRLKMMPISLIFSCSSWMN